MCQHERHKTQKLLSRFVVYELDGMITDPQDGLQAVVNGSVNSDGGLKDHESRTATQRAGAPR